MEIKVLGF